jgi:thioredoxin reductase (NADPH)
MSVVIALIVVKEILLMEPKKIAIIGSGPSGLTAAIYTSRGGLDTTVYAGNQPGGQLTTTTVIENFPGFVEGIDGPVLMETMQKQSERFGTKVVQKSVTKLSLVADQFEIHDSYGGSSVYDGVIIASGATARYLNLPGEEKYIGRGYHSCATCDGFFYKGKEVIVIGGGDSAMEDATFLTKFANHVTILNRSERFRASKIMFDRVVANPKVTIETNKTISEFIGETDITSAIVLDTVTGEKQERTIDGIFVAIGHDPNTAFVQELVEKGEIIKDELGYLKPVQRTMTGIEGIFIAGDVEDSYYRQAITAAGDGCRAAMDLEKWIESK